MVPARPLVDPYRRTVRDLRVSVTDRCNLRCAYCMPADGLAWLPRSEILTFEEIERVARVCVERFGFDGIRITGGEPTVRAHLPVLVAKLAALGVDLSMTTNGVTLAGMAAELRRAGLGRVNVSLDSLRPDRFAALTRRDELPAVIEGIDAAVAVAEPAGRAAPPPAGSATATVPATSAWWRASPAASATPATGSGSRPTASSATACSPCGRPISGPCCAVEAPTTTWRPPSRPRSGASGPATASATSTSSARPAA